MRLALCAHGHRRIIPAVRVIIVSAFKYLKHHVNKAFWFVFSPAQILRSQLALGEKTGSILIRAAVRDQLCKSVIT